MAKRKFTYNNEKFCKAIKIAREARGMTQAGVAELTGLTVASISRLENDKQQPSAGLFMFLCWFYDLDTTSFMWVSADVKKTAAMFDLVALNTKVGVA